jgi:hypothetical protein
MCDLPLSAVVTDKLRGARSTNARDHLGNHVPADSSVVTS